MDDFLFLVGLGLLAAMVFISFGYMVNGTPIIIIREKEKGIELGNNQKKKK